jgi:DNA topoisomerase-3
MVGAIDAVCAQDSRIIGRLQEGAKTVGASLFGVAKTRGTDRPPTSATKRLVDSSAQRRGLQPPRGYTASSAACRAFLDQHARKKDQATAQANANKPAPTRRTYTRRLAPDRGNSVVLPAPIEMHQSQGPDEPNRKANGRKRSAARKPPRGAPLKPGKAPSLQVRLEATRLCASPSATRRPHSSLWPATAPAVGMRRRALISTASVSAGGYDATARQPRSAASS